MAALDFDYVIVGAGSAGCVLANRLSAMPDIRVALVEAGPAPRSLAIRIPAGIPRLLAHARYNWLDQATGGQALGGRSVTMHHGRTLGGSSAINGMVYNRGHPRDFDDWRALGNAGWSYAELCPHFEAVERDMNLSLADSVHPSVDAFLDAAVRLGWRRNEGFADNSQEGAGHFRMTIARGLRMSAFDAFVRPFRRTNLAIMTGAEVSSILVDEGRAHGVILGRAGDEQLLRARAEIILCAGAIDTPTILLRSGIGPGHELRANGVRPVQVMPGVGQNLQDHVTANIVVETLPSGSLNTTLHGIGRIRHGLRYLATRTGPAAMGSSVAGVFDRVAPDADRPDIQISFRPFSFAMTSRGITIDREPRFGAGVGLLRPRARGQVRLRGPDLAARPIIELRCLEDDADMRTMVSGMRRAAFILGAEPISRFVTARRMIGDEATTDPEIRDHVARVATSMGHPVGSCRMGADPLAVVDERLRVRGIERLRIADASVMPRIVAGNTNAATLMIGHVAASFIRTDMTAGRPHSNPSP